MPERVRQVMEGIEMNLEQIAFAVGCLFIPSGMVILVGMVCAVICLRGLDAVLHQFPSVQERSYND